MRDNINPHHHLRSSNTQLKQNKQIQLERHHHQQTQKQQQHARLQNSQLPHHNVSTSHYSTEKSGSSGYYGSNLYSTSSVDEHIYSEPVIDKYESRKAVLALSRRPTNLLLRHNELVLPTTCALMNVDENIDILRKKIDKLPTIMEGIDGQIPRPVWPSDYDDSLVDLNLEPFVNNNSGNCLINNGIDNPAFSSSDEEYVKHYEESLTIYQTRGILEDIRQKLNGMLEANNDATEVTDSNPFRSLEEESKKSEQVNLDEEILKLKNDLDEYLGIINQENEKEIKLLCDGISKDTKLLTLQNALVNKSRSSISDSPQNPFQPYHNLEFTNSKSKTSIYQDLGKDENHFGSIYVKNGFNLDDMKQYGAGTNPFSSHQQYDTRQSIRSSDPNFHFQRKPLLPSTFMHLQQSTDLNELNNSDSSAFASQITCETSANNSSDNSENSSDREIIKDNLKQNLALHHPPVLIDNLNKSLKNGDKDMILEWHKNKPSIWELYYGKNRQQQAIVKSVCTGKNCKMQSIVPYVSNYFINNNF